MRSAVQRMGLNPAIIEPLVRADLVIDHTVTMDNTGSPASLRINSELEAARNKERYAFLKWGAQAFNTIRIIPPQTGIVHQVNLEYLAQGYLEQDGLMIPGYADRYGQPHAHGQRAGHCWLGRGWY